MTIEELIEKLQKVKDKTAIVYLKYTHPYTGDTETDEITNCEEIDFGQVYVSGSEFGKKFEKD